MLHDLLSLHVLFDEAQCSARRPIEKGKIMEQILLKNGTNEK
jgi:hypothetical protein